MYAYVKKDLLYIYIHISVAIGISKSYSGIALYNALMHHIFNSAIQFVKGFNAF